MRTAAALTDCRTHAEATTAAAAVTEHKCGTRPCQTPCSTTVATPNIQNQCLTRHTSFSRMQQLASTCTLAPQHACACCSCTCCACSCSRQDVSGSAHAGQLGPAVRTGKGSREGCALCSGLQPGGSVVLMCVSVCVGGGIKGTTSAGSRTHGAMLCRCLTFHITCRGTCVDAIGSREGCAPCNGLDPGGCGVVLVCVCGGGGFGGGTLPQ